MLGNVVRFLTEFRKRANFYCNISPLEEKSFLNGCKIQRKVHVDCELSLSLLSLGFLIPFFAFTKSEKRSCVCSFGNKVVFHKKVWEEETFPLLILTGCGRVIMERWRLANAGSFHVCFCLSSQGALPIHIPIPIMILLFIVVITINSKYNLAHSSQEPAHSLLAFMCTEPQSSHIAVSILRLHELTR